MENQNIILFSSGITERNGMLAALIQALEQRGYACSYWRDLFEGANDPRNIALLPTLIKKIPTFDYAILVCEGHDRVALRREQGVEQAAVMRDNVLFEIGLCVMALGLSRTILVTDAHVRMPDDLLGAHGALAVKRVLYQKQRQDSYLPAVQDVLAYLQMMEPASQEIDAYIHETKAQLSPVVIGASSSLACGYVTNFIFRTLEHIAEGVQTEQGTRVYPIERIFMHIVLPEVYQEHTAENAQRKQQQLPSACVTAARNRPAWFHYRQVGDELHIIDYPTTIVTSYHTAKMILDLDADDKTDVCAAQRFYTKELHLFEASLRKLLSQPFLRQVIEENYPAMPKQEKQEMFRKVWSIVSRRLDMTRES